MRAVLLALLLRQPAPAAPLPLDVAIAQPRSIASSRPRIVLVLDYSGSMSGIKIVMMKEVVIRLTRMRRDVDWAVVLFDDNVLGAAPFGTPAAALARLVNLHDAG